MSASAIRLEGLRKVYRDAVALDSVDLDVEAGSVFGFLGLNGAGKTTTLRILTGLARPTAGAVHVFGMPAGSFEARLLIGYLPDVPGFYGWMNAEEFLGFAGGLFGIDRETLSERVPVLLDLAGLSGVKTRIAGYSRGMRQRLGIAQALINAPRVLLLDEPTSALDPVGRKDVLEMIAALRGRTTVFFSTHILADVERVCDHVAILHRGRVVLDAPIEEIARRHGTHRIVVEIDGDASALAEALRPHGWAAAVAVQGPNAVVLTVTDAVAAGREVPALVSGRGFALLRYEIDEAGLEETFVELVGGESVTVGGGL